MMFTDVFVTGGTVAQTFERTADAERAATRLRAAGFPDVRLSERSGKTAEPHVAAEAGTTEVDFATSLESAGFMPEDARKMTRRVADGAVLLTVMAGNRAQAAVAVLRGEAVTPVALSAVDVPVSPVAAPTAAATIADVSAAPAMFAPESRGASPLPSVSSESRSEPIANNRPAAVPATPTTLHPDDQVIALREERLDVTKERSTSEARIRKEIVTEQRTITVPVTREQLVVERDGEDPVRIPLSEQSNPNV